MHVVSSRTIKEPFTSVEILECKGRKKFSLSRSKASMFGGSSIVIQVGLNFCWSILRTFIAFIPTFHYSSMESRIQLVQGANY